MDFTIVLPDSRRLPGTRAECLRALPWMPLGSRIEPDPNPAQANPLALAVLDALTSRPKT